MRTGAMMITAIFCAWRRGSKKNEAGREGLQAIHTPLKTNGNLVYRNQKSRRAESVQLMGVR